MTGAIINARILTPDEIIERGTVLLDNEGRIAAVGREVAPPVDATIIDAGGDSLVPGYVDLHVHGGGGYSLATRDTEEIRSYARWVVATGVTSFVATIFAGGIGEGLEFVRTAAEATGPVEGGANVLGVNLEGPFVSEKRRGALPRTWLRGFEPALLDRFADTAEGKLRLITIAPEVDENEKLIARAVARGVTVAIGHSDADSDTVSIAFNYGASHITHLFNAMRPFHHRDTGTLGAAFDHSAVTVELIADGVHVDPVTVAIALRLFGAERIALVTDGVTPAGLDQGEFTPGDERAKLSANRIALPDGTIAGGAETMDHIVRNVASWGGASLAEAVRMASLVPARILGLAGRKGRVAPGYDADLVVLDGDLNVVLTWVQGRLVHRRA